MALLQNATRLNAEPIKNCGGTGAACVVRSSYNLDEQNMNYMVSFAGVDQKSGKPNGYCPPYQWTMPIKDGGMSAYGGGIAGAGSTVSSLSMGKACSADLTGTGGISISSLLSLLVQLASGMTGAGEISISSILSPAANLSAGLTGLGEIDISSTLKGLAWAIADLTGAGSITADLRGKMWMSADIAVTGELTAVTVAEAVWSALSSQFNIAETMGEKLNSRTAETTTAAIQIITNAIKAKTDNLPADPTSKSDLETAHGLGSWESGIEFVEE